MPSKADLRRECRTIRNSVDAAERGKATNRIRELLLNLNAVRGAKTWFVYVSYDSEVGTHGLIRSLLARGDTVTVPRIAGSATMVAQRIRAWEDLHLGEFGILAPPPDKPFTAAIDVCICPGIAFTEAGERLGSGRGFYDRYLATHPPRLAIGLAFECQMVPELPLELHDRRMDFIVTEKRAIHIAT